MDKQGISIKHTWQISHHPDEQDIQNLRHQLVAYNIATAQIDQSQDLAVFVRDQQQTLMAGVAGWIWGTCLEIQYLWVHPDLRGYGYGTRLLQLIEQEARTGGCTLATLDTYTFQAPAFYQKLGYHIFGTIDGYPHGYRKVFLKKRLQ